MTDDARLAAGALAAFGRRLLFAPYTGRLEVLPAAGFGEHAVLLHLLIKPPQKAFEGLAFAKKYLGQTPTPYPYQK